MGRSFYKEKILMRSGPIGPESGGLKGVGIYPDYSHCTFSTMFGYSPILGDSVAVKGQGANIAANTTWQNTINYRAFGCR